MAFPAGAPRRQVTSSGDTHPQFSADGRELLFFSGGRTESGALEGRLMVVPLTPGPSLTLGVPHAMFTGPPCRTLDIVRDGRLLVARRAARAGDARAMLVENWPLLLGVNSRQ